MKEQRETLRYAAHLANQHFGKRTRPEEIFPKHGLIKPHFIRQFLIVRQGADE